MITIRKIERGDHKWIKRYHYPISFPEKKGYWNILELMDFVLPLKEDYYWILDLL